jgi:hypothetical protein
MEIKLKEIAIIGGVAALGYYLYTKMKKPTSAAKKTSVGKAAVPYKYPMGIGKDGSTFELKDGDYVANGEETAYLLNGELRPITAAYAAKFAYGTWDRTKILDNAVYISIPRGAVLDV